MNVSPPETHRYAQRYASRGLAVVPIPVGQKSPVLRSWQRLRIEPEKVADYFNGNALNIGILLGEPSGGVVEVDCDVQEAVAAAPYFLSKTARSGRESSPESHWWYRSQGIRSKKFQDADGAMLLELRSTGCQTLVAPSLHPEGDRYLWAEGTREIVEISPKELGRRCRLLATATLVARHLPPVGGRHDFALALAGFLLRENRLDENEALRVMEAAWSVAEGSTVEAERDLRGIVRDTARNLASGADVVGGRRLEELTPGLPQVLGRWLVGAVFAQRAASENLGRYEDCSREAYCRLGRRILIGGGAHAQGDSAGAVGCAGNLARGCSAAGRQAQARQELARPGTLCCGGCGRLRSG